MLVVKLVKCGHLLRNNWVQQRQSSKHSKDLGVGVPVSAAFWRTSDSGRKFNAFWMFLKLGKPIFFCNAILHPAGKKNA